MLETTRDFFLNPDHFFETRVINPPRVWQPALVVLVVAILAGIYAMMSAGVTARLFTGPAAQMSGVMGIIAGVSGFFMLFLLWVIIAGIFFLLSMAFAGNGPYLRTLECTGFGMVPIGFSQALDILLAAMYLPQVSVTPVSVTGDPAAIGNAVTRLMQDPAMHTLTLVSTVLTIIFLIWAANIWIFGIRHARGITLKNAVICVIIPVAAYFVLTIGTLVLGQGGL